MSGQPIEQDQRDMEAVIVAVHSDMIHCAAENATIDNPVARGRASGLRCAAEMLREIVAPMGISLPVANLKALRRSPFAHQGDHPIR